MKKVIFIFLLLSAQIFSYSQNGYTVVYEHLRYVDTVWVRHYYSTNYFSDSMSYSFNQKRTKVPKEVGKRYMPHNVFFNYRINQVIHSIVSDRLPRYRIIDTITKLSWTLLEEEKEILGIKCKKAIAYFKDEPVYVWYAPSLTVGGGPTFLNGAPGSILEAYIQYTATISRAIYFINSSPVILTPSKGPLITQEEYLKLVRQ